MDSVHLDRKLMMIQYARWYLLGMRIRSCAGCEATVFNDIFTFVISFTLHILNILKILFLQFRVSTVYTVQSLLKQVERENSFVCVLSIIWTSIVMLMESLCVLLCTVSWCDRRGGTTHNESGSDIAY